MKTVRLLLMLVLLATATAPAAAPPDHGGELAAAQTLLQAGQPARAQAVLDRLLARQPDLARARYLRGQALQQQQRWDEALNDYVQVLAVAPGDPALHLNIGYIYLVQQQPVQARQELHAALAGSPPPAIAALAHWYLFRIDEQADPPAALAQLRAALAARPDDWTEFGTALVFLRRHDPALAGQLAEKNWRRRPTPEYAAWLAEEYRVQRRPADAAKLLAEAAERWPADAPLRRALAEDRRAAGDFPAAAAAYRAAWRLNGDGRLLRSAADAYQQAGDRAATVACWEELLRRETTPDLMLAAADAALAVGDHQLARSWALSAARRRPGEARAYACLQRAAEAAGDVAGALAAGEQRLALAWDIELAVWLVERYLAAGRKGEADELAARLEKDNSPAGKRALATVRLAQADRAMHDGDLAQARTRADQAVVLDGSNATGLALLGEIKIRAGDRPGARSVLESAGDNPRALLCLAEMARLEGDTVGCAGYLRRYLAVGGSEPRALLAWSLLLRQVADPLNAAMFLQPYAADSAPQIWLALGGAWQDAGLSERALPALERANRLLNPPPAELLERLMRVHQQAGRWPQAAVLAERLLASGGERPAARLVLARAAAAGGDAVRAEAQARLALAADSSSLAAQYELGQALFARRDYAGAVRVLRHCWSAAPRGAVARMIGRAELQLRHYPEAVDALAKAQQAGVAVPAEELAAAWRGLGVSAARAGQAARADERLTRAEELKPSIAGACLLGRLALARGDVADARARFDRQATALAGWPAAALLDYARLLLADGSVDTALAVYRQAARRGLNPTGAELARLAETAAPADAARLYDLLIAGHPRPAVFVAAGEAALQAGDRARLEWLLTDARARYGRPAAVELLTGMAAAARGDAAAAAVAFAAALAMDPALADAADRARFIALAEANPAAAADAARSYLARHPGETKIRAQLPELLARAGQYRGAVAAWGNTGTEPSPARLEKIWRLAEEKLNQEEKLALARDLARLRPRDSRWRAVLARLLLADRANGGIDRARGQAWLGLTGDSGSAELWLVEGEGLLAAGAPVPAAAAVMRANEIDSSGTGDGYGAMLQALYEHGEHELLRRMVADREWDASPVSLYLRARLAAADGDSPAADRLLRQCLAGGEYRDALLLAARGADALGNRARAVELMARWQARHPGDEEVAREYSVLLLSRADERQEPNPARRSAAQRELLRLAMAARTQGWTGLAEGLARGLPGEGPRALLGELCLARGDAAGALQAWQGLPDRVGEIDVGAGRVRAGIMAVAADTGAVAVASEPLPAVAPADGELAWLEQAVQANRDDDQLRTRLAAAYLAAGEEKLARGEINEALRRRRSAPALAVSAQLAARGRQWDEAAMLLQEALRLQPSDFALHRQQAEVMWHLGRLPEAERHARLVVTNAPDGAVWRLLGDILSGAGQPQAALEAWRAALARGLPDDAEFRLQRGGAAVDAGDYAAAVADLGAVEAVDPANGWAQLKLGVAWLQLGALDEALPRLTRAAAATVPETRQEAGGWLTRLHAQTGELPAAREAFGRTDGSDALAARSLARLEMRRGEAARAFALLAALGRRRPPTAELVLEALRAGERAGLVGEALALGRELAPYAATRPAYHASMARLFARAGQRDAARLEAQVPGVSRAVRALAAGDTAADILGDCERDFLQAPWRSMEGLALARAALTTPGFPAIPSLLRALARGMVADRQEVRNALAVLCGRAGLYRQALELADERDAYNRAWLLCQLGDPVAAEGLWERMLASQPDDAGVINNLAVAALRRGDLDRSLQLLEAGVSQQPADGLLLANYGLVLRQSGRYDAAADMLARAAVARPERPAVRVELAETLYQAGRYREARRLVDRLAGEAVDNSLRRRVNECQRALNRLGA